MSNYLPIKIFHPDESMRAWKAKIANILLASLFKAPTTDGFLQVKFNDTEQTKGIIFEDGIPLAAPEATNLSREARTIQHLAIYQKLHGSLRATAYDMLFNKSKTIDDMIFAKAVLYALDVFDQKLKNIGRLS